MTTFPTQRRPIKQVYEVISATKQYDTESPASPSSPTSSSMKKNNTLPIRHHSRTSNPLNVYKADQDRKGASFKIILFLAATTCYTAFLYSGADGSVTERVTIDLV